MIKVYADGGARGNPGPAAVGVYIVDEKGNKIVAFGEQIGIATNNVAEYKAVIKALLWLLENKEIIKNREIHIFLDSKLIFSQILGIFKIKQAKLRELLFEVREKEAQLGIKVYYFQIPREQNKNADKFVNFALDNKL